jgi:hypothetical protein
MQTNIEEMANNYNLARVEVVRDVIHKPAREFDQQIAWRIH